MIYSGLDWSGSPGDEHGPWLVFGIAHIDETAIDAMNLELAYARARLRLPQNFVFHHSEASLQARRAFFAALARMQLSAHVYMMDKAHWTAVYVNGSTGTDCIVDGIITLIASCPSTVVGEQMLYIDLPRSEGRLVQHYRTMIRQALRRSKRPAFRDVKPRPDDRDDAALIQIADMIAGEVREQNGMAGSFLPALRQQITIV